MDHMFHRLNGALLGIAALLLTGGCNEGPGIVRVTGTVTMDSEPLPDAWVTFRPVDTDVDVDGARFARPSVGVTDSSGYYSLEYSLTQTGALPGKYRVEITAGHQAHADETGKWVPAAPETVPEVYNAKSTLTAEVSSVLREFNFDLDSMAGRVVRPAQSPL